MEAQRVAMAGMEDDMRRAAVRDVRQPRIDPVGQRQQHQQHVVVTNEQLDRENRVVVEILTDEEATALERWWPRCHGGTHALRFAVPGVGRGPSSGTEVQWGTPPCRECDPSSRSTGDFVVRNRLRKGGHR